MPNGERLSTTPFYDAGLEEQAEFQLSDYDGWSSRFTDSEGLAEFLLRAPEGILTEVDYEEITKALAVSRLRSARANDELRERSEHLEETTRLDELTKIYNRRGLEHITGVYTVEAVQKKKGLVFMMSDLDHFKEVNDRGNHALGDEVLVEAADTLNDWAIKWGDFSVTRYGGDEFIIVGTQPFLGDPQEVYMRVEKALRREFRTKLPRMRKTILGGIEDQEVGQEVAGNFGVSIGGVYADPEQVQGMIRILEVKPELSRDIIGLIHDQIDAHLLEEKRQRETVERTDNRLTLDLMKIVARPPERHRGHTN